MPAPRKPIGQKRDHRERDRPGDAGSPVTRLPTRGVVKVPPASRSWHPIARQWYKSLDQSGHVGAYEPSDWAAAQLVAHQMSALVRDMESSGEPIKASAFQAIWVAMGDLLTTETARRKAQVVLTSPGRDPEQEESTAVMQHYADMFRDIGPSSS